MKKVQEMIANHLKAQSASQSHILKTILGCCFALSMISHAVAQDITGNVRIMAGNKQLESDDWHELDSQNELGVIFDIKRETWPVSIALDLMLSGNDSDKSDAEYEYGYTIEQHLGIRKTWSVQNDQFHPYIGGGLAIIHAGLEQEEAFGGEKDDDQGYGGWIGTGAYWSLTENINVGLDIRYSQAEITVYDKDIKAGGTHAGLTMGYQW
jgi:opacity protein-like surface antigen